MGQQVINGLFLGSIYSLFALGYTLVFGVLDILNLAHAAVFMLACFVALTLVANAHLSIFAALPLAIAFAGLLGILLERVAFRPLRDRSDSPEPPAPAPPATRRSLPRRRPRGKNAPSPTRSNSETRNSRISAANRRRRAKRKRACGARSNALVTTGAS